MPLPRFPHWDGVYCLVPGTPLPPVFWNHGARAGLPPRSLNLQDLHAKSREHGSYGRRSKAHGSVLELRAHDEQLQAQIVKDLDYRQDNLIKVRLSYLKERSQEESARCNLSEFSNHGDVS